MSDAALSLERRLALPGRGGLLERTCERALRSRLGELAEGRLEITDGHARQSYGAPGGLEASVTVRDAGFWPAAALRGSVGAGEAYAWGWWDVDDLVAVIRILLRNREVMERMDARGLARFATPVLAAFHSLRRNTRGGSRRNIAAHYDLGNDAFALLLDETMTYSCAVFEHEGQSLRDAQVAKIDRLCRKLALGPSDHLLEIGTGWGALAIHAAREYGCRVTTTTLSRRQHELATERVRAAGLEGRVTLLLEDYRDLTGRFDALVSVEMIEAVGHEYLPDYFRACCERLTPSGRMALQAITIADHVYEQHRRSVDFIKLHVFPGSNIPSMAAMMAAVARSTDLRLVNVEEIGPHYAPTLAAWRAKLLEHREALHRLGWTDERVRGFEFYLAYCEAGFEERYLGDAQLLFVRPDWRGMPPLAGRS